MPDQRKDDLIKTLFAAILISALGLVVFVCYRRKPHIGFFARDKHKKELQKMCFGDQGAAARLMRMELQKNPGISEQEAYRRAAEKLRRHRS